MKKCLAIFCLLIFSIQVLPIKQIGAILAKGQITEELHQHHDNCNGDAPIKLKKDGDPFHEIFLSANQNLSRTLCLSHRLETAIHAAERLPSCYVRDIFAPPPNA